MMKTLTTAIAALLIGATALAQEATCPGGACAANPPPAKPRPAECACGRDCACRPRPPHHLRAARRGDAPQAAREGRQPRAERQRLTKEERAKALRARAQRLLRMADDIEAGKAPARPAKEPAPKAADPAPAAEPQA